jgi:hypothetical protein
MIKKYLTEERFNRFLIDDFVPLEANVLNVVKSVTSLTAALEKVNGRVRNDQIEGAKSKGENVASQKILRLLVPVIVGLVGLIIGLLTTLVK